jgi:hypothetical protein
MVLCVKLHSRSKIYAPQIKIFIMAAFETIPPIFVLSALAGYTGDAVLALTRTIVAPRSLRA